MSDIKILIPLDEVIELAHLLVELDYRGKAASLLGHMREHFDGLLIRKPEPQLFGVEAGPHAKKKPPPPPTQADTEAQRARYSVERSADDLRRDAAAQVGSLAEMTWWHVAGRACPRCGGTRGHWHLGMPSVEVLSDFEVSVPKWALCPVAMCDRRRGDHHTHAQLRWGEDRVLYPLLAGNGLGAKTSGLVVRWEDPSSGVDFRGGGRIMAEKEGLAGLKDDQIFTLFVHTAGTCPLHNCVFCDSHHRHDGLTFTQYPYLRERLESLMKP